MLKLDWNLVFTVINLVVLYFLLRKFLIKPVQNVMEKRKNLIDSQFAEADQAKADAEGLKTQYEQSLAGAKEESERILTQSHTEAKTQYSKVIAEAGIQAEKIVQNAHSTMEAEREQAMREIKTQIAGLAMEAAEKITYQQAGSAVDSQLYDQFLAKAGEEDDTDGK